MSRWRVWMAPDDGLAALWSYRELPDGRFEYDQIQVPYDDVWRPTGPLDFVEAPE